MSTGTDWHRTFRLILLLMIVCTTVAFSGSGIKDEDDAAAIVLWMRNNGGRVDKRFGLGSFSYEGGTYRGAVALENIAAGTEILFCPWKLVFGTEGNTASVPTDHCAVLRSYAKEVVAGKDSFWYPYLSMDNSLTTRIPLMWHKSALNELQGLPPSSFDDAIKQQPNLKDWFCQNCVGGKPFDTLDKPTQQSLISAITRAAGMRFMPIFDLLNHHNGLLNTISSATVDGNSLTTTKDIAAGEEIFNSYRGGRETSSEIFRRYGFIEHWPQQWAWVDSVTSKEERFLLLPNDSLIIDPPDSMTSHIGQRALSLHEMQSESNQHSSMLTLERLTRFSEAGRRLLESLPTTVEEDLVILVELNHNLLIHDRQDEEKAQLAGDTILAVSYRMHFKEAIETAIKSVENILLSRQNKVRKEL